MGETSIEMTCICGKARTWIKAGEELKMPCPFCGRKYRAEYDPKELKIKVIEIATK